MCALRRPVGAETNKLKGATKGVLHTGIERSAVQGRLRLSLRADQLRPVLSAYLFSAVAPDCRPAPVPEVRGRRIDRGGWGMQSGGQSDDCRALDLRRFSLID